VFVVTILDWPGAAPPVVGPEGLQVSFCAFKGPLGVFFFCGFRGLLGVLLRGCGAFRCFFCGFMGPLHGCPLAGFGSRVLGSGSRV